MHAADTILAHASAPGQSPRAIIRASGVGVGALCERILKSRTFTSPDREGEGNASTRTSVFGSVLSLPGVACLPVIAMRFFAPASYTGEDVLEIQVPGNPHLVERVVRGMLAQSLTVGARQDLSLRLAHPGEFTARAYFNRKLTLEQAEGVAATIAARTSEQLAASKLLLEGETGRRYKMLADECATLLALVESGIDFADQDDVIPIAPSALSERLLALREAVAWHLGSVDTRGAASHEAESALPRVAIVGRPNAGKSTLFNALLGRSRAVASPIAGTTRDVLVEALDLSKDAPGSGAVVLLDLPGLDSQAADQAGSRPMSPDSLAQLAARDATRHADAILWCDPSGLFDADPSLDWLFLFSEQIASTPMLRVRTFGDRIATHNEPPTTHSVLPTSAVAVCALDGWNLGTLRRALADLACAASAGHLAALLPRHRLALSKALASISEAIEAIDPAARSLASPELIADSLRAALDQLGELVGQISPDDVLGRVFATFCVGK